MASAQPTLFDRPASSWLDRITRLLPAASAKHMHDSWRLRNGTAVTLRAVRPDDGPLLQELVRGLSLTSRYHRFFYALHELTPELLARFTQADPKRALTLLAVIRQDGRETAIGMAQYAAVNYPQRGEFAAVVADAWQRNGIAQRLIRNLMCIARAAGIEQFEGDVLAENLPMQLLLLRMDFAIEPHPDGDNLVRTYKVLLQPAWKCSPLAGLAQPDRPALAYA